MTACREALLKGKEGSVRLTSIFSVAKAAELKCLVRGGQRYLALPFSKDSLLRVDGPFVTKKKIFIRLMPDRWKRRRRRQRRLRASERRSSSGIRLSSLLCCSCGRRNKTFLL
jgi:hypothetical protein